MKVNNRGRNQKIERIHRNEECHKSGNNAYLLFPNVHCVGNVADGAEGKPVALIPTCKCKKLSHRPST